MTEKTGSNLFIQKKKYVETLQTPENTVDTNVQNSSRPMAATSRLPRGRERRLMVGSSA